jgi:hypothetical protein
MYQVVPLVCNPLNADLNPVCHLLALLGAHNILHISRIRVKWLIKFSLVIMHGVKYFVKRYGGMELHYAL